MKTPVIRRLGICEYQPLYSAMQAFTADRDVESADQFWFLQHKPVFTLGQAADESHILQSTDIPVIRIDRGGQVTYHGPGQLVVYTLLNHRRLDLGVKGLVSRIETSILALLEDYGLDASLKPGAPGVYINDAKIAALGLRVSRNGVYHGLSLNVDMDLAPFDLINPCGHENLAVTQLKDLNVDKKLPEVAKELQIHLLKALGYTSEPIVFDQIARG